MDKIEFLRLIKRKDVSRVQFPIEHFSDYTFEYNQEEYHISKKVLSLLQDIFSFYANRFQSENLVYFKESIKENLKIYSLLAEHQKNFIGELIIEKNKEIIDICYKIYPTLSYLETIKSLYSLWFKNIRNDMAEVLVCLKSIVKDKKFENVDIDAIVSENRFYCLHDYFQADEMQCLYEAILVEQEIKYLRSLLENMKVDIKPVKSDFVEKGRNSDKEPISNAIAIMLVIKGESIDGPVEAGEKIKEYFPEKFSQKAKKKVWEKYLEYMDGGFLKNINHMETIRTKKDALSLIMQRLLPSEQAVAKSMLETLNDAQTKYNKA